MATVGDVLSGLAQQIRLDKLETLLGTGNAPAGATPTSALSHAPVPPVGAGVASDGLEAEQLQARAPAEGSGAAGGKSTATVVPPPSTQTRLSPDGILLGRLLARTEGTSAPALPRQPIDMSTMPPALAARALAHSLAASGLFYESHLREWFAGERPQAALKAEPHNRLPLLAARLAAAVQSRPTGEAPAAMPAAPSAAAGSTTGPAIAPLPEALVPVVREQLETLETGRVLWQGEVWPQQSAQLVFAQDDFPSAGDEDSDGEADAATAPWQTTLRIELPNLGVVEAVIRLDAAGVAVNVRAEERAMQALQPGRATFTAALEDAGIALHGIEMRRNDAT